ncbi:MAG: hypothetical protein KAI66_23085 [Lentisphaeria bacterium]|nr:hypothetical protein [Lentisphaeria bacterium]
MATVNRVEQLEQQREEVRKQIADVGDLRPGSLVGRYRRCGKPNCHCAMPGAKGHGPSWSLTRAVGGKTITKVIPEGPLVDRTREQIAEYRRYKELVRHFVELSEQLCDARLREAQAEAKATAKKGGSKRHSKPKSSPRSKRS